MKVKKLSPKKGKRAWFERKVNELGQVIERPPGDRREQVQEAEQGLSSDGRSGPSWPRASSPKVAPVLFADLSPGTAEVILDGLPVRSAIRPSSVAQLDILPGSMKLASADLILSDRIGREAVR